MYLGQCGGALYYSQRDALDAKGVDLHVGLAVGVLALRQGLSLDCTRHDCLDTLACCYTGSRTGAAL